MLRVGGGLGRRLAAGSPGELAACAALLHTSGSGGGAAAPAAVAAAAVAEPGAAAPGAGGWHLAFAALLGLAGGASVAHADGGLLPPPDTQQGFSLMPLEQRRRVFFKYEKRIRELSPPEKVFEYFASQRDGKSFSMTPGDMMRSVVPVFPPEGSSVVRAGSLPGEPSPRVNAEEPASPFIAKFDIDGDQAIGFDEYLLFQTMLAIPVQDIEVAFRVIDRDGSGRVSRQEFLTLLEMLHAQAGKPSVTMRKSVHSTDQDLAGLMQLFFGKDGTRQLSLDEFRAFLIDLRGELVRLEFAHYDWKQQGSISGRDFAHSVISSARLKHIDLYLDRVENMPPDLAQERVSLKEFQQFRAMWGQLRLLSVALEFLLNTSGRMGRKEFMWTVQHVMAIQLSPKLVDTLFWLFADPSRPDSLNVNYMYEVMNRHVTTGLNVAYRFNKPASSKSYWDCLRECKEKTQG